MSKPANDSFEAWDAIPKTDCHKDIRREVYHAGYHAGHQAAYTETLSRFFRLLEKQAQKPLDTQPP